VKEYLSQITFFYNTSDATKVALSEKAVKREKVPDIKLDD